MKKVYNKWKNYIGGVVILGKKNNGALKKKMEHEQSLAIDNEKKEPIKNCKIYSNRFFINRDV